MQAFYPQPRGRPRNNATWNTRIGRWVQTTPPMLPQQVNPVIARAVNFIAEAQRKAAIEKEAQERAEKLAAENIVAEAAAIAAAAERTRNLREQERLNAPRRYALSLDTKRCPVYYFDVHGNFRQLHHEPVANKPTAPCKPTIHKKNKVRRVRMCGPSKEHNLATDESEYISE